MAVDLTTQKAFDSVVTTTSKSLFFFKGMACIEVAFSVLSFTTGQLNMCKPPAFYILALDHSDWLSWESAMQWEMQSLEEKGVFE